MDWTLGRPRSATTAHRVHWNMIGFSVIMLAVPAVLYYVFVAIFSGDLLWVSTQFDAQPREITIIDRSRRTIIGPTDARFAPIVDGFNRSIRLGYQRSSSTFTPAARVEVEQHGLLVEATYAEPVRLHIVGGAIPTKRFLMLVECRECNQQQLLFTHPTTTFEMFPLRLDTLEPLRMVLHRYGFGSYSGGHLG
jgi:hypothetical protein